VYSVRSKHFDTASLGTSLGMCFAFLLLAASLSGCALVPDVRHKQQLVNPFPQIKTVAILPFVNQSEEPTLSGERVSLAYMHELQAIRGFEVLPLGAIRNKLVEFNQPLRTGQDFQAFAQFLNVDAVMVGSIVDYQPYYPPRMTMKVSWYAANPAFHPVLPGYGLPWGTKQEKDIPRWVHQEAQRALASEQLKSQTPVEQPEQPHQPILPEDRRAFELEKSAQPVAGDGVSSSLIVGSDGQMQWTANPLPVNWPDPRGFIPDDPSQQPPPFLPQREPIISHMTTFNGHDEDFTEQLADYFYFRDDARFGGWQSYLQRSEDFIRFCCHLHLSETLISRGGQDQSRMVIRWPIVRYSR
jgi:hypothetical protein